MTQQFLKIYTILFFLLVSLFPSFAQSSFSKIYRLDLGVEEVSRKTILSNDTLYVFSKHTCDDGIDFSLCISLTKFDLNGNLLETNVLDDFWMPTTMDVLVDHEDNFIIAGHWTGPFLDRPMVILKTDKNLNIVESYEYPVSNSSSNGDWLIESKENYFICGNSVTVNGDKSFLQVLKVDKSNMEKVWLKDVNLNHPLNTGVGFQLNPDSITISFLDYARSGNERHHILTKIDLDGNVLNTLEIEDMLQYPRMESHSNGDYYFNTSGNLENWLLGQSINHVFDNDFLLNWSIPLPSHYEVFGSRYNVKSITECKNGDLLLCGGVGDYREFEEENHNSNGFLLRLNTDGDVVWFKSYRLPRFPLPIPEGKHWSGQLLDVFETESGGFIANGEVLYGGIDVDLEWESWLLSVDENGCLRQEECEELVVIDGNYGGFSSTLDPHNLWTEIDYTTNLKSERYRYRVPYGAVWHPSTDKGLVRAAAIERSKSQDENDWAEFGSFLRTGTYFDAITQEYHWRPDEIWLVDSLGHQLLYDFSIITGDEFTSEILP